MSRNNGVSSFLDGWVVSFKGEVLPPLPLPLLPTFMEIVLRISFSLMQHRMFFFDIKSCNKWIQEPDGDKIV